MTISNHLTNKPGPYAPLVKYTLAGAALALILIAIFLSGVNNPKPEWGSFWMLKPFVVVPLAGAAGGALYVFINNLFNYGGWKKALAVFLGVLAYTVTLWIGTVLGLNGTLWN